MNTSTSTPLAKSIDPTKLIRVAVFGATGYTGAVLVRLLRSHPAMKLAHVTANSHAGKLLGEVIPVVGNEANMLLAKADAPLPVFADGNNIQLAFTALPHGAAADTVARLLAEGVRVIDLSADFRHADKERYAIAYGQQHRQAQLLAESVYGLTEYTRTQLSSARLVANPGCYPTCSLLPLLPLVQHNLLDLNSSIIIDAKSGTSGAGRGTTTSLLYCEVNEGLRAYGLPRHRHTWEIEDSLQRLANINTGIRFTPHLIPMTRGMLASIYVSGSKIETWHSLLTEHYAKDTFVRILPSGECASTSTVSGSNRCDISVHITNKDKGEAVLISCIDNLLKGASGQAMQNANLMFGLPEETSLDDMAQWP
ncbi:MAG: N-acetyl-gamma-glutamyl-phosphate reductase [Mariprofundales bacterium]